MQLTTSVLTSSLAATLQGFRQAAGLSQRGLAKRCGLTPAYLSLLESGRRAPERGAVERIADALALSNGDRTTLLISAGYAPTGGMPVGAAGPLAEVETLLGGTDFTPQQRALMTALVTSYAQGLAARARAGKPLVTNLAAPWQQRILEAMQEKMAEDFESFRDAYMRPSFDL